MRVFRHGDIVLREEELPDAEPRVVEDKLEVSGETGHVHLVENIQLFMFDWAMFLQVPRAGAVMTHPEHPDMDLPPDLVVRVDRVRSLTTYVD